MPRHIMQYDFKDFERFILGEIAAQGYQLAAGAAPEITDLSEIKDFDDMAQIMGQVIMTVSVVPVTATQPLVTAKMPTARTPTMVANPAPSQEPSRRGNAIKHGWYSTKVELSPEQKAERAAHFRMQRKAAKERKKQASVSLTEPVKEVVAPTTLPFPRTGIIRANSSHGGYPTSASGTR